MITHSSLEAHHAHDHETNNDRMYAPIGELRQILGDLFPQLSEEDVPFWKSPVQL